MPRMKRANKQINKGRNGASVGVSVQLLVRALIEEVQYFIRSLPAHFPGVNLALRQLLCDYVLVSRCCGLTERRRSDNQCDRAVEGDFT